MLIAKRRLSTLTTELRRRHLLHHASHPEFEAHLTRYSPLPAVYSGFDPTAASLHVGNLVTLLTLARFGKAGFPVIALIGGATARVGDPSGRSTERPAIAAEVVDSNARAIHTQISTIMTRLCVPVKVVNNLSWFRDVSLLRFLATCGHTRLSDMLNKDSVRSRHGISLQVGGSDQWGNIDAGISLIRRQHDGVYGLTTPLLTTKSGEKFGKSANNAIWLSEKTSIWHFYQYFLNQPDDQMSKLCGALSFKPYKELEQMLHEHQQAPEKRLAQRALAREMVELIHGPTGVEKVEILSKLYWREQVPAETLRRVFKDDAIYKKLPFCDSIIEVLAQANICSKSEARRLLKSGALSVNGQKLSAPTISEHVKEGVLILRHAKHLHIFDFTLQ